VGSLKLPLKAWAAAGFAEAQTARRPKTAVVKMRIRLAFMRTFLRRTYLFAPHRFSSSAFGRTPEVEHFHGHGKKKPPVHCGNGCKILEQEEVKLRPETAGKEFATLS
jgi:hypothetical protein